MGFLEDLLHPKKNPVTEIDKDVSGLVCVLCSVKAPMLYEVEGCLYCIECTEAHLRRERFKREEAEWASHNE
jgi:hypothetical protein